MADCGAGSSTSSTTSIPNEGAGASASSKSVLDVSDRNTLSPKDLKKWRLFNVVLDGQGTPADIKKGDKPFQLLYNFVVYRGQAGEAMAWPEAKPTIKPYHGSKIRIEGELRRMATYLSGRKAEATMRVVAGVRRFAVDVRRGEQRGIWIESKDVWFLLEAPRPDFAPLMRCYKTWYDKLVLAYDTYLKLEQLELQRLKEEGQVGKAGQVALSQLFNRIDLDLPPLTKADGTEGIEEATYLFKVIQPSTQPSDVKAAHVEFINDYRKARKGHKGGGGGLSEDDTSSLSEMSSSLAGMAAHQEALPAPATLPSATTASQEGMRAEAGGPGDQVGRQEGDSMMRGDLLTKVDSSLPPDVAAEKKRKKVVMEELEEKEEDDDDMNLQQVHARVKATSPSTVPPASSPRSVGGAATRSKYKAAEMHGGGKSRGGTDNGYVIPKKKPKVAEGAPVDEKGGGGGGGGGGRVDGGLAEARGTATTIDDGPRTTSLTSSLPLSSTAAHRVPAPAVAIASTPSIHGAGTARPTSSISTGGHPELKQRLKVLKRPQAALAPGDVPFFLQAWGHILGKDRQRVLEALTRSSDAVRASFRFGGGLGGLVYWLHDQVGPRALGSQERKVLQGESGGVGGSASSGSAAGKETEIFIQMLRLVQGLVEATADMGWNVDVEEWRTSQAGAVLASVEERLAPHMLDGDGGEAGRGKCGRGVWPQDAKLVATGIVHTIRAALALAERYPTPVDRAHLDRHPPQKPSVVLQPARVGEETAGSEKPKPARALQSEGVGGAVAVGALVAATESRRTRQGLRVSFKHDDELRQVHTYKGLKQAADEQARHAVPMMAIEEANEDLEKAQTCFVS